MSNVIFNIGVIIVTLYHMCFADFWRGWFFAHQHITHRVYIATCPDGTKTAICEQCKKSIVFKQKMKEKFEV